MSVSHAGRPRFLTRQPLVGAMASLACWLYAAEPLAVAQAPQPCTTAIRVLKGAEQATSYFQEGNQADTTPSIILIKGAERSEWSFLPGINQSPIIARRSLLGSYSRDRTISGGSGTGHHEAKGAQADVPFLSTAAKPTQEKSKPLSITGLGFQAPVMEEVLAPGGFDPLRKPGQEEGASRSRAKTISDASGTGHKEAKGAQADVPSLSTAANPTQEKSTPLSTTGLGFQAPLMEEVPAPGGFDPLRKPGQEQESGSLLYKIALVHMIDNLATMSLGLVLFAGTLFFLLRRFGQQLETFSRLQFVNAQVSREPDWRRHSEPERDTRASADASSTFGLGPTYAEEMQLKDEAARHQEDAVLRQIFEQNLQLREQISALSTVNT